MSVPLGFKTILDFDGQMWLLNGKVATKISSLDKVKGPKVVLSDLGKALTGIETVNASKSYAPAIIEKQLRDRGDMEGASQVLILNSKKKAGATDIFYAALPIGDFSSYMEVAKGQNDHCLYIPVWNAMLRGVKNGVCVVVFQHGDVLDVLITENKTVIHSMRVSSSSYGGQDWESALNYLSSELNQVESERTLKIDHIQWYGWCGDQPLSELADRFESLAQRQVTIAKKQALQVNDNKCDSNVVTLLDQMSSCDAVKAESSSYLFTFERVLPWVAGVALAVSAGAFLAGVNWQQSAQDYKESTEKLLASTQFESKLNDVRAVINNADDSVLRSEEADFIDSIHGVAKLPSIPKMIGDIQSSVNPSIHVTSLSIDTSNTELKGGMVIEGYIDQGLDFASLQVQQLVQNLVAKGYVVEDKGFIAKSGNNGFQLVLIPRDKE